MYRAVSLAAPLLFIAGLAHATVMIPLSVEDMARDAKQIVRAKVADQHAAWGPNKKHIFTYTTLEVLDPIAGDNVPGQRVVVRSLGGEVGDVGMRVAGTPNFRADEEVVVFLRADPMGEGRYQVIGMSQGKYRVIRESSGRVLLLPGVEGVAFAVRGKTGGLTVDPHAAGPGQITMPELRRRVGNARAEHSSDPSAPNIPVPAPSNAPLKLTR